MNNIEIDFTSKFLVNLDRLTTFFRSEEISIAINLKLGKLLEEITRKEIYLRELKSLAAKHYNNDININNGFEIMLKQIVDLKKQIITNENTNKKTTFNSGEFENGYRLIKERLRQLMA